ncbi:MAG TPA: hypothetical protein VMA09_17265 [Candidatus Binataceae bacterium]|nr:hypothetical protein [Candidatus Binataceae bacterium]
MAHRRTLSLLTGLLALVVVAASGDSNSGLSGNLPWYPSLAAFEHYDSGRSHLFPQATFGGRFSGNNTVTTMPSEEIYPSGWNMTYLDADQMFLYGGASGNDSSSIGAYVARIDPNTLRPVWYDQLINTADSGEWDYPGAQALLDNGKLYVIYGYRLSKIDPLTGKVLATLVLPTGDAAPADTTYNGFTATSDGTIVAKAFYRQAGCTVQGPDALAKCPDPSDVPDSVLVTINPNTMTIVDQTTFSADVIGRATVAEYNGHEYVYFFVVDTCVRYEINQGHLTLDSTWNPGPLLTSGQTSGWALVVLNDWVVGQSNGLPASAPLSVFAVNQGDASKQSTIQPFAGDPIPPLVKLAFSKQGPGGTQAVSWNAATVSVDPESNLIYAMDALPGEIAGVHLSSSGLETAWKAAQTTTEFIAIIGPPNERVIVGSDIPGAQIPDANTQDEVVWRKAATGQEIARSARLPAMTSGTMVQPYYFGEMFYPGAAGSLYRLEPAPADSIVGFRRVLVP